MQALTVGIKVPWPLAMVIDSDSLSLYNKAFAFLIQVTMWLLLQMSMMLMQALHWEIVISQPLCWQADLILLQVLILF